VNTIIASVSIVVDYRNGLTNCLCEQRRFHSYQTNKKQQLKMKFQAALLVLAATDAALAFTTQSRYVGGIRSGVFL
jgi:hypothetical protein